MNNFHIPKVAKMNKDELLSLMKPTCWECWFLFRGYTDKMGRQYRCHTKKNFCPARYIEEYQKEVGYKYGAEE